MVTRVVRSDERFSIETSAVGADMTPMNELAKAKMDTNEVFMMNIRSGWKMNVVWIALYKVL